MARAVGWRLLIWGAFLALGLVTVARTGIPAGAPGGVFATAQSLATGGGGAINGNTAFVGPLSSDAPGLVYVAGVYRDIRPPLAALLATPATWVGLPIANALDDPGALALLIGTGAILLLALAAVALVWAGRRLGMRSEGACGAAALGIGAFLFPVGALTDTVTLVALVVALLALIFADGADRRVEEGWMPRGRLVLAGLLLGLLPFVADCGIVPLGVMSLVLIAQGGRRWWRRVGWLLVGILPALGMYALLMQAWYGRPWRTAWWYAVGASWQRSVSGRYLDTPIGALHASVSALGGLLVRHPLIVVGLFGLLWGLIYLPWRARVATSALLLSLVAPAVLVRQLPGGIAEEHPLAVLVAFAAAGYLLLVALVARDYPRLLPWVFGVGSGLVALGAVISVVTKGAARTPVVAVGTRPAVFVAPVGMCVLLLLLLVVPALGRPRVRTARVGTYSAVATLLLSLLAGCGSGAPTVTPSPADVPNLLPPLSTRLGTGVTQPLWTLDKTVQLQMDGLSLAAPQGGGTATAPRILVQAGDDYRFSLHVAGAAGGAAHLRWLDGTQQTLAETVVPLKPGDVTRDAAGPPETVGLVVILVLPQGATVRGMRVQPLTGGRLDPLPNYYQAALAFSFDWETAMGGLIHTRGGETTHDVADAEARGLAMRDGAVFLERLFRAYDVKATFYVNGYNFLTGNTQHRQFVGNPTYNRYTTANAGFASDYWTNHPWYGDDPYGTEQTNPAWYFGTMTKQLLADGQDIQSHTFGHLFLHSGITSQQLDDDLTAWDQMAKEAGVPPAHSFAFPWGASNSLTPEYYAVFAKHGITNLTRFYDPKPPALVAYQMSAVPGYPGLRVFPDQQLLTTSDPESSNRTGDETVALRSIDLTLALGGTFSLWTHPESITTAAAQSAWTRVVQYATDRRAQGLWVAPVTAIADFADARDHLRVTSTHVGDTTTIVVMNDGPTAISDATLTLPRTPAQVAWTGGTGTRDVQGARVRVSTLAPGAHVTLEIHAV